MNNITPESLAFYEAFSGIGGGAVAAKASNFRCVGACEQNPNAATVYWLNNGHHPHPNAWTIDPSKIDPIHILFASPPCTSYSKIGKRKGLLDPAGRVVFALESLVAYHKPKAIIIENVCEFATFDGNKVLEIVSAAFERYGYHSLTDERSWRKLNSAKFGAATQRVRFFGVMLREDFDPDALVWPDPSLPMVPLSSVLLPEDEVRHLIFKRRDYVPVDQPKRGVYSPHKIGYFDKDYRDRALYATNAPAATYCRSNSGLASSSGLYKTEEGIIRKLHPREMLRSMGYSDSFVLPMPYGIAAGLIGNSLCPPVLAEVFKMVKRVVSNRRASKCA